MENIKLLKLLSKLSKQEFLSLGFYLKTPSFNKNKELISLYEALSTYAPSFIAKKIDTADVFGQIYPKLKFSNIKLNHLCSLLTINIQNFLASIELRKEEYIKERLLLKRYDNKKFTDDFKIETKNFKNHLNQKRPLDLAGHYHDFWLERASYYHTGTNRKVVGEKMLYSLFNHLKEFYQLARLEIICEMANREKSNAAIYDAKYYNLSFLETTNLKRTKINNLKDSYISLFSILQSKKTESILPKVERISKYINNTKINKFEKSITNVCLINVAGRLISSDPKKGISIYFQLMFDLLEFGEFTHGGHISPGIIMNISIAGIEIGEAKKVNFIINNYGNKITLNKRESVIKFVNSMLLFSQKKYDSSLIKLNTITDTAFSIKSNVELLNIRIYFEKIIDGYSSEEELFSTCVKRYKKYLSQSKLVSAAFKESNTNFLVLITKLHILHKNKQYPFVNSLQEFKLDLKSQRTPLKLWMFNQIDKMILKFSKS